MDERKVNPKHLNDAPVISYGFVESVTIQDFPIRGKRVYLHLRRRSWLNKVERLNCKFFNSVITTMQNNYAAIVNYFEYRSTNASAESFNAKVKAFSAQFRGVRDIPFFIFRLTKLFA